MEKYRYDELLEQEEAYQFESFSREDALTLGLLMIENAKKFPDPSAIEITLNGLSVFRYFPEGTSRDNELWLCRKRNSVELMEMSSLRFAGWLEERGESMQDRKLDTNEYAAGGGGFPLIIKGTGVIGSVCVSGMPHLDDHRLVVDSISDLLMQKYAKE